MVAVGILTIVIRTEAEWRDLARTIEHELRVDAYGHVQGLGLAAFEDRSTSSGHPPPL